MTGLSWAEEHFKAQLGEVEAASRLVAVLGNDQAMAVLREFRVTKREV